MIGQIETGPLAVLAAGGTGGHMFPAQALAEALVRHGWRVRLSTDARGARYTGGFPHVVEVEQVRSATFARGGAMARLAVPAVIGAGVLSSVRRMLLERPAVVVGFGGYPTIPALSAAWLLRIPRMIHEQNAVLGRVNELFARRVDIVACGTPPVSVPRRVRFEHTGNPVRQAVLERAGAEYRPPDGGRTELLVIGGSQGARILSDVVPEALAGLPAERRATLQVSHQAREEDIERVRAAYAGAGISAEVRSFFHDVPERMRAAQLVISRAGASSLADIAVIGRPAILVPLAAAIRGEQTANARGFVEAGAAIALSEPEFTPERLRHEVETILSEPDAARAMAEAAARLGRPDATERLVALVEELAEKKQTREVRS